MKKTKIGIVGLNRGANFLAAYKCMEDVEIRAVCENSPQILEQVRKELPENTQIFDEYTAFLDSGLDAVILANYFCDHAAFAIQAMKKGIHVFSETSAATTLGECVQLCEAVEETGCKYMLATNVPVMPGPMELDRLYREGSFGRVLYAEAEYLHPTDPNKVSTLSSGDYHWRKYLPRTYYNMHDLGTLMMLTGTLPKRVNAKAIFAPDVVKKNKIPKKVGDISAVVLTEMDNGAVFRTTACSALGPHGKWFRLSCENGTIETKRGDQDSIVYDYNEWSIPQGREQSARYPAPAPELNEAQEKSGHGGTDYLIDRKFIDYLNGGEEPFFNVYRSVALSAAGILAWRSVLDNGNGYEIPDFTDKEARKAVADDFLTPFPKADGSGITLPCTSQPYHP